MNEERYIGIPTELKKDKGFLPPYIEAGLFLLCGMIIGGGATTFLLDHTIRQTITQPELLPTRLLERMENRLGLTEEQSARAEEIIAEHFATFDGIRREIQPDIQQTVDALRDDLANILDDSQRQIWENRFEEIRAKWRPGPVVPTNEEMASRHRDEAHLKARLSDGE